ncbi:MAG: Crp/Fnr family transcriptional regulator [Pseudomonadota bacterium]
MNQSLSQSISAGVAVPRLACDACAIRNNSLCGALSREEIAELNAISRRKRIAAGQTLVMEGDAVRDYANVISGIAKLIRGSEDGRTQIVGLLFPSDFLGNTGSELTERHSIEAASDLEVCLFPRERFNEILTRHPTLEHSLLERTMTELEVARDWMVLLGRKTAEERVASFLLHAARRMRNHGCKPSEGFDLPISRTDIADYIGLTIETVSRHITKLRKEGVIEMSGTRHLQFVDIDELERRCAF